MMSRKQKPNPTQAELEILQILWQQGPSTVRMVNEKLHERRPVVYTTTLKLMQIMAQKKLVTRSVQGRSHVYSAMPQQEQVQDRIVDKLISTVFAGSSMDLVLQALGNHKPSQQEIEQIRHFLDEIEKGQK